MDLCTIQPDIHAVCVPLGSECYCLSLAVFLASRQSESAVFQVDWCGIEVKYGEHFISVYNTAKLLQRFSVVNVPFLSLWLRHGLPPTFYQNNAEQGGGLSFRTVDWARDAFMCLPREQLSCFSALTSMKPFTLAPLLEPTLLFSAPHLCMSLKCSLSRILFLKAPLCQLHTTFLIFSVRARGITQKIGFGD